MMTMRFGLDYAWTTIAPSAHRAVGSSFACRYLSPDLTKNLSLSELHTLEAGGIDVAVVWEYQGGRALQGEIAGIQDAHFALAEAARLGMPAHRPIYFAVDFDEAPGQAPAVADYFRGIGSVLGVERTGCYGGYWVVSRLFDAKLIAYGWQTYGWSGTNIDPRAQLYQFSNGHRVAGSDCDYNHSLAADFGQWSYKPAPPPPSPAQGAFEYELQVNFATGDWRVRGLPGTVTLGGPNHWASAKGSVDAKSGLWGPIVPLPWNAPPLGG